MKFKTLNGREQGIDHTQYEYKPEFPGNRSSGEQTLGDKLVALYPRTTIYEQFPCVGTRMHLDFYVPFFCIAFEFDGRQHDEFVPHFHGDRAGFAQSKARDSAKERWCELNGIRLVRVTANTIDELETMVGLTMRS